jgi:hypothetical protein
MTKRENLDSFVLNPKENKKVEQFYDEDSTKCGFWVFSCEKLQ